MSLDRWDRVVIRIVLYVATMTFIFPCISYQWQKTIPSCTPFSEILVYSEFDYSSNKQENFGLKFDFPVQVHTASDYSLFVKSSAVEKIAAKPGNVDRCQMASDYLNCSFRSDIGPVTVSRLLEASNLELNLEFDDDAPFAGLRGCGCVFEIARILNLTFVNDNLNWRSVSEIAKTRYLGRKEELHLGWNELFAIFMPLLMPVWVMFLRQRNKR
jgi:hypothetical protein